MRRPKLPTADVCLILEGTYPYVRGGVSSWVHELITGLPEVSFALLAISATRRGTTERRYELPRNVCSFAEVYIHELVADAGRRCPARHKEAAWRVVKQFHGHRGPGRHHSGLALIEATSHPKRQSLSVRDAFFSRESWDYVLERYQERAPESSFIDYFWTWRAIHAPLFQTLIAEVPPARVYHATSTGYAGLLGVVAKLRQHRPLVLTEHGIYVRERAIDIAQADWIYEEPVRLRVAQPGQNPLKEMWINFFATLGELTYSAADLVVTLFRDNQKLQHELGADPRRTRVIPNGVDIARYTGMRRQRSAASAQRQHGRVAFVGRVVPIKDVKTLIKAFAMVARKLPDTEFWIVGPTDEDEAYARECRALAESLGVSRIEFLGPRDVNRIYPEIDLLVLTSISEGQPLTILEAACAGVPTVATEVGACRELCEGGSEEDRALGPSGIITRVGAPGETAAAIGELLADPALRARMASAGMSRAERFYRQDQVLSAYRDIYAAYGRR
jgi:glycosyltransferase involved in cell wall biosynthesis